MAFKKRTTAPSKDNKWFYKNNPFYACGYGLPNCTAYAWGRFAEILGKAPALSTSNAENWYSHKDGYARGKTPKPGAVIVWAKGKIGVGSDGAGHVAIVEEVYSDGSFLVSESGWKASKIMWLRKIPKSCERAGYRFLGFIYNPGVKSTKASDSKKASVSFSVGKTYTLQADMYVRASAGTYSRIKKVSELTADGKKCASQKNPSSKAVLLKGTKVTVLQIKLADDGVWIRIPSGWVCGMQGKTAYVK